MKIGIIGIGVVGSAVKHGFEKLGHEVSVHDIKLGTSISEALDSEICYVCVPTPSMDSGRCDTSIVESVVSEICQKGYEGIIAIKSTVTPGTTDMLQESYPDSRICFVPEFLRERCAISDFIENHDLCAIGTSDSEVFRMIQQSHGKYPSHFIQLDPIEAELCKYFSNLYNATLITFANNFCELCEKLGASYDKIKNAVVHRNHINDNYLDCNENFRGFGGVCLPKDTKAIAHLSDAIETKGKLFERILEENKKYKVTVYKNMRKS